MKHLRIVVFIILITLILAACGKEETTSYKDFQHIDHWDDLSILEGETTIIYFYNRLCPICIELEEPITKLLKELENDYEIFLIEDESIFEQGEPPFELPGVPSLLLFEQGEFDRVVRGSNPVIEYLENALEALQE